VLLIATRPLALSAGFDYSGGNSGKDQYLSSPWDVIPYSPQPDRPPSSLLVAMAGTHQIWQVGRSLAAFEYAHPCFVIMDFGRLL
jgi:hypothetical protein